MSGFINASIVRYKQPASELVPLIHSLLQSSKINKVYVVDNSPEPSAELSKEDIRYLFTGNNLGYGKAHNIAIRESIEQGIPYHVIVNPDIQLLEDSLEVLYDFMESTKEVGLVMPKIVYPDDSIQYLCKKLSTPFDLFGRRFLPGFLKNVFERHWYEYELRHKDYNSQMDVPNLSGCFMFVRTHAFVKAGMFDPRYFMYLEDIDLSRRILEHYRTVYYPKTKVCHAYEKGSYKNKKLLFYHISSAISYFNKWGWFFDSQRKRINRTLR